MSRIIAKKLEGIAGIDIFKEVEKEINSKMNFVGFPIELEYERATIVVNDFEKKKVKGIPQGCFLICVNTMEERTEEVILLRVLQPTKLPSHSEILASRVEYYKEFIPKETREFDKKLDSFTRNEFQYSGLECRILGTFYREMKAGKEIVKFGADVENFFSSHNYTVYKPDGELLKFIVNYNGESSLIGGKGYSKLGQLRYSSARRKEWKIDIPIYINPKDLLKNRTACFGMTRTGKSNTVKKIIDCTVDLAKEEKRKIGQIIFDINGEYANPNKQDEGTAIYEKYKKDVARYSLIDKNNESFIPMRANFYNEPEFALQMIRPYLQDEGSDYVKNFNSIDLALPTDKGDPDYRSILTRTQRVRAAFLCCLNKAEFKVKKDFKFKFPVAADLVDELNTLLDKPIDPREGITLDQATKWFEVLWEKHQDIKFLKDYYKKKDKHWLDDDIKTLLRMLTLKNENGRADKISGYKKLRRKDLKDLHTPLANSHFEKEIISQLRAGKIIIVDLSEGPEIARNNYSERIVSTIFNESMSRFIENQDEQDGFNVIQLYFEEAHNLFPKKEKSDLSDIYNRLAKEGAKYNLGINYATQEVSSISSNILKNTQNWFIAHLNNKDEIRELIKFYDFEDFADSILRIKDKGFIRMKTYSNDFIVPVQIDKFTAE
ncbi:MAG: DUF87 domain-containing protein [Marinisporobacter sp.]|jgi:hypothetical protein|nr:DUF87 domain-containing protein [Marinisporobacter sp.]